MAANEVGSEQVSSEIAKKLSWRYANAYRVAGFIVGLGTAVKVLGVVAALGVYAVSSSIGNQVGAGDRMFVGVIAAIMVGFFGFVVGVLVSAQGELLRATLDGAVNNSPFLTNDQRAS